MRVAVTKRLFAWDCLEDNPSLRTIREFLRAIPDGRLLDSLRAHRGHGRDEYPVEVLWGVILLTILLRHPSLESCLGELKRNEALRWLIGIESEGQAPKAWNISRFLSVLGREPQRGLLSEMFNELVRRMGRAIGDLGKETAGDATGLCARRPPAAAQRRTDCRSLAGDGRNTSTIRGK